MNRRAFLRVGGVSAVALLSPPLVARANSIRGQTHGYRIEPFELEEATISGLQAGFRNGKLSAVGVAKKYLARIDAIDRRCPCLKSVLELNPEALEIAATLDQERKAHGIRSP